MKNSFPFPNIRQLVTPLIAILTAGVIIQLQWSKFDTTQALKAQTQSKAFYSLEEKQIESNTALFKKLPSLGYDNIIADWAFLSFIQYFGDDKARQATGYRLSSNFFETIVERDPTFLGMYPYLSASITLFGGNPTQTVKLLQQGTESIPEPMKPKAYFLWQAKGTDELLFLRNPKAAQASYEKAAEWASSSEDPEIRAIAARAKQTAQFLSKNPYSRNAQASSWFHILSSAIDDQTRTLAISQIKRLGGNVVVNSDGQVRIHFPES